MKKTTPFKCWNKCWTRRIASSLVLSALITTLGVVAANAKTPAAPTESDIANSAHRSTLAAAYVQKPITRTADHVNHWYGDRVLSIWRGDPSRREIALTFDDGPHPAFTARLLDLLHQLHVKATFFLVGMKVDEAPEMVQRIASEGHEVGNHTYHHINLDRMTQEAVEEEIRLDNEAIKRACGRQPVCFRPPGGHHSDVVLRAAAKLNMTCVLWTDDPADFAKPGPDVIEGRIFREVGPGSDILLHDGIEQTLQILPDLVGRLRRDGYRFVTMSEMARHLEAAHIGQKKSGTESAAGLSGVSSGRKDVAGFGSE